MTCYKEHYCLAQVKCCLKLRSSRSHVFFKKGLLKNFTSFTGKHLCWSLLLIKLQASRASNLFLQNTSGGCFENFLSSAHMPTFFMCSLLFSAPRSHSECYKHSFKNNNVDPVETAFTACMKIVNTHFWLYMKIKPVTTHANTL